MSSPTINPTTAARVKPIDLIIAISRRRSRTDIAAVLVATSPIAMITIAASSLAPSRSRLNSLSGLCDTSNCRSNPTKSLVSRRNKQVFASFPGVKKRKRDRQFESLPSTLTNESQQQFEIGRRQYGIAREIRNSIIDLFIVSSVCLPFPLSTDEQRDMDATGP